MSHPAVVVAHGEECLQMGRIHKQRLRDPSAEEKCLM